MVRKTALGLVVFIAMASVAEAQATRTWVSGVGDDANPCSRTAPCKTFAGAISKTAAGGYIDVLDAGGFGAVTITKAITIDGNGFVAGILSSTPGSTGVVINAGPQDTIILRNLSIEGAGAGYHGIRIIDGGRVFIEDVTVQNFTQNAIVSSGASEIFIRNTTVKHGPSGQGIYLQHGRATLDNVSAAGFATGVFAGYDSVITVKNSIVSGNDYGFCAAYGATFLNVESSVTAHNIYGVFVVGGGTVRLSNTAVMNSFAQGVYAADGTSKIVSFQNNRFAGNPVDGTFTSTLTVK